jgi:diguanylate cyclase
MAIVRFRPADLQRAIAENTLSLQFQPQVFVANGNLVGAEALVRWPHPSYGMIGPGEIIPLVEQGAFHLEFDRWVITAVCEQLRVWNAEGFTVPIVAANIWTQTLRSPGLLDMIGKIILKSGVAPRVIEIEVPKGTVSDPALAEAARRLRVLGVRVASEELADPSLIAAAVDFDTLKIGYPIARDLFVAGSSSSAAASAVVEAARSAGARAVADSVETAEQEQALHALGCEIVQGYLYGPEVSAAELKQLAAMGAKAATRDD